MTPKYKASAFSNLSTSTCKIANNLHDVISNHPAAKHVRIAPLYDALYRVNKERCVNLYVARNKAALTILASLDNIAHILKLISPDTEASQIPEDAIDVMLQSLGVTSTGIEKGIRNKHNTHNVTHAYNTRAERDKAREQGYSVDTFTSLITPISSLRGNKR